MLGTLTDNGVKMNADLLKLKGLLHVNFHPSEKHNKAESAEHKKKNTTEKYTKKRKLRHTTNRFHPRKKKPNGKKLWKKEKSDWLRCHLQNVINLRPIQ